MKPAILATAALLLLSGCAGFKAVDAAMTADVGDGISVTPQIAWSKVNYGTGSATVGRSTGWV